MNFMKVLILGKTDLVKSQDFTSVQLNMGFPLMTFQQHQIKKLNKNKLANEKKDIVFQY